MQARQSLEETNWLLKLAGEYPFIRGVVGWVDLCSPEIRAELSSVANNPKLVGIRHIVQDEADDRFLLRPDFLRGVAALEEFDLAYDILIFEKHLPVAAEFVRRLPRQRFVLDHMAKPPIKSGRLEPWTHGIRELASSKNVCCKVSGLVTEADWAAWKPEHLEPYLEVAFGYFGPDRLMIGSDWPVCLLAASYTRAMETIQHYLEKWPEQERDKVLGENAAKFYKLGDRN